MFRPCLAETCCWCNQLYNNNCQSCCVKTVQFNKLEICTFEGNNKATVDFTLVQSVQTASAVRPVLYWLATGSYFSRVKGVGKWSQPHTCIQCRCWEWVAAYLHAPICLHLHKELDLYLYKATLLTLIRECFITVTVNRVSTFLFRQDRGNLKAPDYRWWNWLRLQKAPHGVVS